ncbi:MAG: NAD(+) synthase [Flavobacteriia bacterium]|nr:NAD(+) synthase [Flavobacteriia bacterium]
MNTDAIIEHITDWLKAYVEKSGTHGFVVGVSGGIDSAVTSSLCARTGLPTLCVEMPIHQAASQVTRAQEHIAQLKEKFPKVEEARLDLTPIFDSFVNALPEPDSDMHDHSLVNTRARFRMTTLYYFAGIRRAIVAGTGNKVEDFGVGFYTKYGDGGVDVSPIADLVKTEVFELGKVLGVPESILIAPPTDGLWGDDRTDEDQIGASYPELEWAMAQSDLGKDASDFSGREKEVFEIYTRLHRANRHKMEPIPVCEIPEAYR